ncbi:alcohol dehydrogenase catalytic domain-containing protein [Novosphingobium rosa]|uniref:alcohol dehydrogenase catalytic domain-containing protein n=1 Tax=Novosphingobium rosa TaxID=76978 RepID=UPI0008376BFF|nr:alcohol dehydrogenase catalytic domain-containing protein [Novosphingobium rosa]
MKAAVFHAAGQPLTIEERPMPEPGPGQILIQVRRCGICGSDLTMTDPASPLSFQPGCVPGHEFAGEVVAVGRDVAALRVGDRVSAFPIGACGHCPACLAGDPYGCAACSYMMGGFGEFALAQASLCVKLPGTLSFADGALVEPLACGAQAARMAGLGRTSRVLVLGAGPIGLAAIYWAQRAGCRSIVAAAPSLRRRELALEFGASQFLSSQNDLPQAAAQTLGGAPDVVFECAGKPGAIAQALECLANRGTVVSSGMCFAADSFVPGFAVMKQARLQFSMAYTLPDFRAAAHALDASHVAPRAMVSRTVPLSALPRTLEELRQPGNDCKVLVTS